MARWLPDTTEAVVYPHLRSLSNLSGFEGRLMEWSGGVVPTSSTTSAAFGVLANAGNAASANVALAVDGYIQVIAGNDVQPGGFGVADASARACMTAVTSAYCYSVRFLGSASSGEAVRALILNPPWRF